MLGVFQIWLNHFNAWKVRRGTVTAWILEAIEIMFFAKIKLFSQKNA
jgi:hypothetical protein